MARLYSYPAYYGAVFPTEDQVLVGINYGPTGAEYTGTLVVGASYDPPNPTLLVGYSGDWLWVDGVEDAGYEIGPQRTFRDTTPDAPSSGVKIRRSNPSKADLIVATSMGVKIETTDMTFTVWAETLADPGTSTRIEAERGDFLVPTDGRWRILNLTKTVDGAQFRCYCRLTSE